MANAAAHTHEAEAEVTATAKAGVQASLPRINHCAVQRQDPGQDQFLPVHGQCQKDILHQDHQQDPDPQMLLLPMVKQQVPRNVAQAGAHHVPDLLMPNQNKTNVMVGGGLVSWS